MDKEQIRDYVSKYMNQYSKQSIINQLVSHGAKKEEVELVFKKLESRPSQIENKPPSIILILFLVILFFAFIGVAIFSVLNYINFDKVGNSNGLLPNKLDLTNNLRGDTAGMLYDKEQNELILVASYVGASRVGTLLENSQLTIENNICPLKNIKNLDTLLETPEDIEVLNGQILILTFDCSSLENIKSGDILEGEVNIILESLKTGIKTPSAGNFRLLIQ